MVIDKDNRGNLINLSGQPTPVPPPDPLQGGVGATFPDSSVYGNVSQQLEDYRSALRGGSFVGQDRGLINLNNQRRADLLEAQQSSPRTFNDPAISAQIDPRQAYIDDKWSGFRQYQTKSTPQNPTGGGLAGGVTSAANQFAVPKDLTDMLNKLYAGLETSAQEQLGGLETEDFSEDIQELINSGRLSAEQLSELQQQNLVDAEGRALDKISQVEADVMTKLQSQEDDRRAIQQAIAEESALRTSQFQQGATDRTKAAREALGPAVSSEFEEVAELTSGLTAAQAMSDAASASRLRQVAGMAAAERLAAPAQLAAEAQMAVGDQKFQMENQLRIQLAQNIAQLDTSEREMLLQEAMRQEQFGLQRDQALANAMFQIAQQKNQALLGEQQRLDSIQQRQSEILQQQGFQRQMAAEARAAAGAASAKQEAEIQAQREARDKFLFETMANDPNSRFANMTQEQFDQMPETWKDAMYGSTVQEQVGMEFPEPVEPPEPVPNAYENMLLMFGKTDKGNQKTMVANTANERLKSFYDGGGAYGDEEYLKIIKDLKEEWTSQEAAAKGVKLAEAELNYIINTVNRQHTLGQ